MDTLQICFRCAASKFKGNEDFQCCYTDVSMSAKWRDEPVGPMWAREPAMSNLHEFHDELIALDLLHVLHLGVTRDLVGTGFKLLCRSREFYSGSSIDKRLSQLTAELKSWCRSNGEHLSLRRIHKNTLRWRGDMCPELKAKGSDTFLCLRFLTHKIQHQAPTKYPGIVACAWAATQFVGVLAHGSIFLTAQESDTAYATGMLFIHSYLCLANESLWNSELLFKTRPKLHYLVHVVEELQSKACSRNPFFDSMFMDEDWIKQALTVKKRMSY